MVEVMLASNEPDIASVRSLWVRLDMHRSTGILRANYDSASRVKKVVPRDLDHRNARHFPTPICPVATCVATDCPGLAATPLSVVASIHRQGVGLTNGARFASLWGIGGTCVLISAAARPDRTKIMNFCGK